MKKLLGLFVIFILTAGVCFAQFEDDGFEPEQKPEIFDLEISVGFPIRWTNAVHPGFSTNPDDAFYRFNEFQMEDKTVTANTAFGLSLLFNFGRKVGFTLDMDFFYGTKITGFSSPTSDYLSLFGVNALLGPVFYLYSGSLLRIPLAIGASASYFSDDLWIPELGPSPEQWMKRRDFLVGPGIYLGVQFHFNDNIYIFSRTNVSVDIWRWHTLDGVLMDEIDDPLNPGTMIPGLVEFSKTETEFVTSWKVKPALGLGIKF